MSTGIAQRRGAQISALCAAFVAVHAWVIWLGIKTFSWVNNDLNMYHIWGTAGSAPGGTWPGLDKVWVYPQAALLPMWLVGLVKHNESIFMYQLLWGVLVALLDAIACLVVLRMFGFTRGSIGIYGWLVFLFALGPISVDRIDAVAVPLMLIGLALAIHRPWIASAVLTLGAWIKISPFAVVVAMFATTRRRIRDVVVPAAAVSLVVAAFYWAFHTRSGSLLGFFSNQGSRGLQSESVFATPVVLMKAFTHQTVAVWNNTIASYESTGYGAHSLGLIASMLLPVALAGLGLLAYWARHAGMRTLVLASYCLIYSMIIFNKVGSPQFQTWIAPAMVVGLAMGLDTKIWLRLSALTVAIALLTQIYFPTNYFSFLAGKPLVIADFAVRNILVLMAFGYACWELWGLARSERSLSPKAVPL